MFLTPCKTLGKTCHSKTYTISLPKIKVGVKVTLIDSVTHAFENFENFEILDTILKDTPIMERPKSQPTHLVKPIDTIGKQPIDITSEQLVDDLAVGVK